MIRHASSRHPHWPSPGLGPTHSPLPIGTVIAFCGILAPQGSSAAPGAHATAGIEAWGWTPCDGRQLSATDYPELFACIGNLYGGQAPAFLLPDLRGYFLRGADPQGINDPDAGQRRDIGGKLDPGVGSRQDDAMRNHVHLDAPGGTPAPAGPVMAPSGVGPVGPGLASIDPPPAADSVRVSAHETRPKNISVHYLIRFTNRLLLG